MSASKKEIDKAKDDICKYIKQIEKLQCDLARMDKEIFDDANPFFCRSCEFDSAVAQSIKGINKHAKMLKKLLNQLKIDF